MSEVLNLQSLVVSEADLNMVAISCSSCDSNSCNG